MFSQMAGSLSVTVAAGGRARNEKDEARCKKAEVLPRTERGGEILPTAPKRGPGGGGNVVVETRDLYAERPNE